MEIENIDLSFLPYQIGDIISVDGKRREILGIHLYIGIGGGIKSVRYHVGNGKFVTIKL